MREFMYIRVIVSVNIILKHIDSRAISPRCEGYCLLYRLMWYQK